MSHFLDLSIRRNENREQSSCMMLWCARYSAGLIRLLTSILLAISCALPSCAEIDATLIDPYLQREFQWATFVDLREDKPYLNYPGSRLNPLTQVRVTLNTFEQGKIQNNPARLYEEFWYHEETPIGLRRYGTLDLNSNQSGAIFLGGPGSNMAAAAKVLVRLAVELELQQLSPSVIVVPFSKYDLITTELGRYSFFARMSERAGPQFSLHLRSFPYHKNKDEYYYLQH